MSNTLSLPTISLVADQITNQDEILSRQENYRQQGSNLTEDEWDEFQSQLQDFVYGVSGRLETQLIEKGFDIDTSTNCLKEAMELAEHAFVTGQMVNIQFNNSVDPDLRRELVEVAKDNGWVASN